MLCYCYAFIKTCVFAQLFCVWQNFMIIMNQFGFAGYWIARALCLKENETDLHYEVVSKFVSSMLVTCGIATFLQTTIGSRYQNRSDCSYMYMYV